jgi:thiamine-phosphate pyrophosphorylase
VTPISGREPPRLLVITDMSRPAQEAWIDELGRLLEMALPGRVLVLLRDRDAPVRQRRALGERLRALTRQYHHWLSVSDRLDLAALLAADAVHLAESSVSVSEARGFGARLGVHWWISSACHAPEQLSETEADAVLLSPIAEPRKGRAAFGTDGLRVAARCRDARGRAQPLSLYALGGVTRHNARELCATGADGVALIGELFTPGAARALAKELDILR